MNLFNPKQSTDLREKLSAHRLRITDALQSVRVKISGLQSELRAIYNSAITREDYARVVLVGIDAAADRQIDKLAEHFRYCAVGEKDTNRSAASVRAAIAALSVERPRHHLPQPSLFGLPLKVEGREGDALTAPMAYALFRDDIKRTVTEAIERIEPWPWPEALALDAATTRIDAINREMDALRTEETALVAEASEFGASA